MAEADSKKDQAIYHEKQRLQMCAVHAINNLFQGSNVLKREDMNSICKELSPNTLVNPHMSVFGVGNYDVNAIMAVMSRRGYEVVWFDKRKSLDGINFGNIYGMFINTVAKWDTFKIPFKLFRHWFAIRQIGGIYHNLDSKLKRPEKIGSELDLRSYLKSKLSEQKTELLLVVEMSIAEERSWEIPKSSPT